MIKVFFCLLILLTSCFADVKSTKGEIQFDVNSNNEFEMTFNTTGLGLGVTPTSNLHVLGNAVLENSLSIGGSTGSSNFNIFGSVSLSAQSISDNWQEITNSVILADTSNGNVFIELPFAGNVSGAIYEVKKISDQNTLIITGAGNLIDTEYSLSIAGESGSYPSTRFLSNGSQWWIISATHELNLPGSSNLVSWWKMDDSAGQTTIKDSSPYGVDGGLHGTLTFTGNLGLVDGAIEFPSTNTDAAFVSDNEVYDFQNFTLSLWIYRYDRGGNSFEVLLSKFNGTGNNREWLVGITNSSGTNERYYTQISRTGTSATKFTTTGTVIPNLNTWEHVAATLSGNRLSLYVNGELDNVNENTLPGIYNGTNNVKFRTSGTSTTGIFDGLMDDVRIYNRALSNEEIEILSQTRDL